MHPRNIYAYVWNLKALFPSTEDDAIELPLTFKPWYAGRYPCHILLESKYDVRLFKIECVVNTDTFETELEFVTPAYQAAIQDIPIVCLFLLYKS